MMLNEFYVEWSYFCGLLNAIDYGTVVKPIEKYSINLPIDPNNADNRSKRLPMYPPIIMPPRNSSGPSVVGLRLELTWEFEGRMNYHPNSDWDIIFTVYILGERDTGIIVFEDYSWRSASPSIWRTNRSGSDLRS
jgi:hypothetical protein